MSSPERQVDSGAGNWTTQVLRSLVSPVAAEDAAAAVAAAWLTFGGADVAIAILFVSSSQCLLARAIRNETGTVDVSIEPRRESVTILLDERRLATQLDARNASSDGRCLIWPHHLAACFVSSREKSEDRLTEQLVEQILARSVRPQLLIPAADRLESLAEFAAGAGHEINNPLGSIIGQTQLLLKSEQQTDRRQALSTIGAQAWRIRDMIGDCMLFARPPLPDPHRCQLNELVRQSTENAAQALQESPTKIRLDLPGDPLMATVDATQFRTLVSHLVRNALEASREADVDERVSVGLKTDGAVAVLTVRDHGPEIVEASIRRHLFDPCFSGRQSGRGLGFGLPVCWQIARGHDGLLLQETPADGGNQFLMAIPLTPRA